jgi:LacI family transcriptional regulator
VPPESTTDAGQTTIHDIARLAGVSIATVSRALNNRRYVAPETRDEVLRIAREHGFRTNTSARALSGGRTGLVSAIVPDVNAEYFSNILAGVSEALHELDMDLVLSMSHHQHDRELTLLKRIMRTRTDGVLLLLPSESADELEALRHQGLPFVIVDPRQPVPPGVPSVSAAHAAGAREATEHLLALGHRRIGVISGAPDWLASVERLRGYQAALAAADIPTDPGLVIEADFAVSEGGAIATEKLLDQPEPPTAIFAFNDILALGALRAAAARGLRVPDDLSIVGFDDAGTAALVTPALTTVRQPLGEMGRLATGLLARLLNRQSVEALHIELETKLVVRGSTAPARAQPSTRPATQRSRRERA